MIFASLPIHIQYGQRMKNLLKIIIIALPCLGMAPVAALPLPTAETTTGRTITVGLKTPSNIALNQSSATVVSAQTYTSTTTLATTVKALQETLGLTQTAASAISIHTATAEASLAVGIPGNDTIASFTLKQSTSATALFASEPLFARSMAVSQGTAGWFLLKDLDSTDPALSVTWDFKDLQLQASPIGSLAYIRDMLNIWQINSEGKLHHDEVGFLSYLINGKVTTRAFDLLNNTDITDWLTANFTNFDRDEDASISDLNLSIPLAFNGHEDWLALTISSTHTQISYEAPPRAVVQVEAAAGRRATGETIQVHWYPKGTRYPKGTLSFDPIPIELLLGSRNTDLAADDPLLGGFLKIGDFTYLDTSEGRQYFSGSDLKLLDRLENPVLTAIAPTLVLEDALYDYQGFNGFAPILMFEPSSPSSSAWLQDFRSYLTVDSPYLPELFIGFDAMFDKNTSFSAPVSALLSFAGPLPASASGTVPEPSVLWLLCGGLILLAPWHERGRPAQKRMGRDRLTP